MAIVCHLVITLVDMKHFKADTPLTLFEQLSLSPHSVCCLHEDLHEPEKLHIHLIKYIKLKNKKKDVFRSLLTDLLVSPARFNSIFTKIQTLQSFEDVANLMRKVMKSSDSRTLQLTLIPHQNPRDDNTCEVLDFLRQNCYVSSHTSATPCFAVRINNGGGGGGRGWAGMGGKGGVGVPIVTYYL